MVAAEDELVRDVASFVIAVVPDFHHSVLGDLVQLSQWETGLSVSREFVLLLQGLSDSLVQLGYLFTVAGEQCRQRRRLRTTGN